MKRVIFLLLFTVSAQAQAQAQETRLGRLFSSPEQRAQLDAQRYGRPPTDKAAAAPEPPPPVELNGVVQRSSGRSTIWLNQTPHNDTKDTLRLSNGQQLRLKPGQRYDPATGRIMDVTGVQP